MLLGALAMILLLICMLARRRNIAKERFVDNEEDGRIVNDDGRVLADNDACVVRTSDGKLSSMDGFLQLGRGPVQGTSCVYRRSDYEPGVMDDQLSQCTSAMAGGLVKAGVQDFEGSRSCVLHFKSPPTTTALDAFQSMARDGAMERTIIFSALHAKFTQKSEVLDVITSDANTQRAYLANMRAKRSELAANLKIAKDARTAVVVKKEELTKQLERQLASIVSSIERSKTLKDPALVAAEEDRRRAMSQSQSESAARSKRTEEPPRSFEHPSFTGRFLAVKDDGELMLTAAKQQPPLRLIIEYGFQGMRNPQKYSALRNVDNNKRVMTIGAKPPAMTERTSESNSEMSWVLYLTPGGGVAFQGGAHWLGYQSDGDTVVMCGNEFDPRVVHWKINGPALFSAHTQTQTATKTTGIFGNIGLTIRNHAKGDGPLLTKVARLIASYASKVQGAIANDASVCTPAGAARMRAKDIEVGKANSSCAALATGFDASLKSYANDFRKQYGWSDNDIADVVTGTRSVVTDVIMPMVCKNDTIDPNRAADLSLAINRAIQCEPGSFDEKSPMLGIHYSTPDPGAADVLRAIQTRSIDKMQTAVCSTLASTLPQKKAAFADFLRRQPISCKELSDAMEEGVQQSDTVTDLRDAWTLLSHRVCGPNGNLDPVATTSLMDGAFAAFC